MLMELRPEVYMSDSFRRAALVYVVPKATATVSVDVAAAVLVVTHV